MFKHILVPVDGSEVADQVIEKAIGLGKAFGSDVTVMYVIDPYPFTGVGTDFAYGRTAYLSAANAEAHDAIKNAQQSFEAQGIKTSTSVVEYHSVWRGILEAADSIKADLIVMGSHGRRGLEKLVLGSETQRVLSHTKLPVFVVHS